MQQTIENKIILGEDKSDKVVVLPNQRVSRTTKQTTKWQKDTIDFFISSIFKYDSKRKSPKEVLENWDFYNSELSSEEMQKHLDPLNVEEGLMKDENVTFGFYDVLHQPFDTLIGEELKRVSEIKAYAINPLVINEKDKIFTDKVSKYFQELVQQTSINEEEVQKKLSELDNFKKKDLQSSHEIMVNQILNIFKNSQYINAKYKFNKVFKNLEIVGDWISRIYHVGAEPNFEIVNSDKFFVLGMGTSNFIQDGYAWIEIDYLNPNKLIEEFAEELTNTEIDKIFKNLDDTQSYIVPNQIALIDTELNQDGKIYHGAMPLVVDGDFIAQDGTVMDYPLIQNGNIRIYRVQWLALRKLGKLKYYDEFGDEQYRWVDEYYPANIDLGEEVEWIWVNELMEGVKILNDIYKKVRVCPVQMRSLINPAMVRPSYVGYVNADNGKCTSRIDRLKPYQRMYNIFANKLVTLWTQNIGKVGVVDVSRIPSTMSTDEWYLWIKRFKLMYINSFEEGNKGAAKGQLAGNMQQSSPVLDLSLSQEINDTINMLTWIETKVNKIASVPEARQGNLTGKEGLGVSQQAVSQSTHQTEHDFFIHDILKSITFEVLIEYTKYLWKDEKGKRQFMLDDLSNYLIDIDGELLSEGEYGIKITNSSKLYEMFSNLKQLTHAAMQNGTATLSDVARMFMSDSPSEMLDQLEKAEDKRLEQQNEQAKMGQQSAQAAMEAQFKMMERKHQLDLEMLAKEWEYKYKLEEVDLVNKLNEHARDTNENGIEDAVELETERIKAEAALKVVDENNKNKKEIEEMKIKAAEKLKKMDVKIVKNNPK